MVLEWRRVEQFLVVVSASPRPCDSGPRAWGSCGLCRVSCERSQQPPKPPSRASPMPASRLWLVALAVRVHGMRSAPTPMSALKGERPTVLMQQRPALALRRHRPASGTRSVQRAPHQDTPPLPLCHDRAQRIERALSPKDGVSNWLTYILAISSSHPREMSRSNT